MASRLPRTAKRAMPRQPRQTTCSIGPQKSPAPKPSPEPRRGSRPTASARPWHVASAPGSHGIARWLRHGWQFFVTQSFSSLTRRIVFLNVAGLLALVDRHPLSLAVPRRPDRRARAEPAGAGRDHRRRDRRARRPSRPTPITIDPDRLLELQPGESYGPSRRRAIRHRISRSIRSASRRCCGGWSRRPRRARASTTATAC